MSSIVNERANQRIYKTGVLYRKDYCYCNLRQLKHGTINNIDYEVNAVILSKE